MRGKPIVQVIYIVLALWLAGSALPAQRLPEGEYHQDRDRQFDILHYRADLNIDMDAETVQGQATLTLRPLSRLSALELDAFRLEASAVSLLSGGAQQSLTFVSDTPTLEIDLGSDYYPGDTLTVEVEYSAHPNAGMYFQKDPDNLKDKFMYTYGEGGLHANWLPIYNDVNDKFSTEMVVTVAAPYQVVSNGKLLEVIGEEQPQRTFHWKQELPHSNYLIALYVGDFEKGDLPAAFGSIPLSYWVLKGHREEGAYAFRNTPRMVEFFSERFNFRYPWDKYDQIALPDYAIGAMEHTGVTGHLSSVLRNPAAPQNFGGPDFDRYHDVWSAEGTISHELAHHWFGDNLTCRNLSYIWLNESFATFLQMLWDEEDSGEEALQLDRQEALDHYLDYVKTQHIIRPLEYHYFNAVDEIYNTEHTYFKGAIVLLMLRRILGDEDFFRACGYYLNKHQFSNVQSNDFKIALEEATGKNLQWFFDDWVYGGGHPVFEVSYEYLEPQKQVDLSVKQVQPIIDGQGLFSLPVEVTVMTADTEYQATVWVEDAEEHYLISCADEPLMVGFDSRGALVAEINFEKSRKELIYQVRHDQQPGRIQALRQLARRYPTSPQTISLFSELLSGNESWWTQAETAYLLGEIRSREAQPLVRKALAAGDYRVRKAAVLALRRFPQDFAGPLLEKTIRSDRQNDVVATAIVSLAKVAGKEAITFIRRHMNRPAWYDEVTIAAMEAFEEIAEASLAKDISPYAGEKYNQDVRRAALRAWKSCAPDDPDLHATLLEMLDSAPHAIKLAAVEMLGQLHVEDAVPVLEQIDHENGDINFRVAAEKALAEIERIKEGQE